MPLISVILPVYNSAQYLREAIDSILNQTLTDFELLLINDGSTDASEEIILSYTDRRIVCVKNPKNLGLIRTLNKAIDLAKGNYIARMDGDDISLPQRFAQQLEALKKDPGAGMACSPMMGITPDGMERGQWPADAAAQTPEQIRKTLPWENCIVHPSVLIKAEILKQYKYAANQKASEDWDLWLRLSRDGIKIVKTKEVLLNYRIHTSSITQLHNSAQSPQIKAAGAKLRFACNSLKAFRINLFVLKTLFTIYKDLGYYVKTRALPAFLRKVKWFFTISPFAACKQFGRMKRALRDHPARQFLFFPYAHVGGAEKVHAMITRATEDQEPFVFITGLSKEADHRAQFGDKAVVLIAAKALYHPFFSRQARELIRAAIHARPEATVFGCNNLFFYELIPSLSKDLPVIDLTHDFDYQVNRQFARDHLKAYLRCNTRVFISNKAIEKTKKFYDENFVDQHYYERIKLIYNYVDMPVRAATRSWTAPYRIAYVGRDTPEKRVELLIHLADICREAELPFEFVFVGEIREQVHSISGARFEGLVLDKRKLSEIYNNCHFVIIGSSSEGFPLSLAEGMTHGCIPLSTAVGDIPFHVNSNSGFLVESGNENEVLDRFFQLLKLIAAGKFDLPQLSNMAASYAMSTFDRSRFISGYRKLFGLD